MKSVLVLAHLGGYSGPGGQSALEQLLTIGEQLGDPRPRLRAMVARHAWDRHYVTCATQQCLLLLDEEERSGAKSEDGGVWDLCHALARQWLAEHAHAQAGDIARPV